MKPCQNQSVVLFDSEHLKSRLMGDDELVSQVLEACVPDINANFRDFVDAIKVGRTDDATLHIHSIKGVSQNANLTAVSDLTAKIEEALRSGNTSFARESVARLEEMVGATIIAVRRYLNN